MAKQEAEGLDALLDEALEEFDAALPARPSGAAASSSGHSVSQPSDEPSSSASSAAAEGADKPPLQPPAPSNSRPALAFNPLGPRLPPRRGGAAGTSPAAAVASAAAAGPGAQQAQQQSGGRGGGAGGDEEAFRAAAAAAGLGDLGDIDDLSAGLSKLLAELAKVDDESLAAAAAGLAEDAAGSGTGVHGGGQRDLASTLRALEEQAPDFGGEGGAEGSGEDPLGGLSAHPEMASLVDSIMQQLLSKDVLYQPMKEIGARYPDWLETNREKLSQEDYGRYCKQYEFIQRITALYESDPGDYSQLVNLLQQMQQCGQPPQEIVDELAPGMQFDSEGLPRFPGAAPGGDLPPELADCCIM